MRIRVLLAVGVVWCAPAIVPATLFAQAKGPVTPKDYGKWETLGPATLSPDGRWLAHVLNRVDERNELRLRGGARDTTIVAAFASEAVFSPDSRWVAYAIGVAPAERERLEREKKPVRNSVAFRELATGKETVVREVASFRFSGDGRQLAMRRYPAEGKRTADLLVQDLAAGTQLVFGNVAEFAWSERKALLAFTVEAQGGAGNGVQLYDGGSGTVRVLSSSASLYRQLAWRPKSEDLAVLRTIADKAWKDTSHAVLAWRGPSLTSASVVELDPARTQAIPADLRVAEHMHPQWAKDGSALYIGLRPRERAEPSRSRDSTVALAGTPGAPARANGDSARSGADTARARVPAEKISDVQVWHARDVRIIPMQKAQEQRDLQRALLTVWHLGDGSVVRIGTDLQETARVLEGGRFAIETDRKPYEFGTMFGRPHEDVWVVDTRTGGRRKALEKVRFAFGASATGAKLLWYDGKDYWTQDVATGARTNLTATLDVELANPDHDFPTDLTPPAGVMGWTKGDGAVLVYDAFDVWSLAPDGSGGRRLTDGARDSVVHRWVQLGRDEEGIDLTKPVYLSLAGKRSKRTGLARLTNGRVERLVLEDARIARLVKADSTTTIAFTRERFDDSPDWFVAGADPARARQMSETNPFQRDYAWGRSELVNFRSASGRDLQAALYYPAGYDPSKTYPMIVYTYELLSQNVHNYVAPSERNYYNLTAFTANGYFVLTPDIVFKGREPGVSVLESVEPAVRAIVARGLVDSARVGMVGHSWGGYEATFLPTRTKIFAASVAGAPITNFLSFAGAIHWTPGMPEFDHWETGQARMDVPPWEDLDAYLRNSPIAKVQDLTTPMLMEFGDADGTVDWHQGIEFYNFARRAGKKNFVMLVYPGEDHGLRKKENQIDYHRRIQQWFGHWLKGEPAPKWMTDGMTWLERKTALDAAKSDTPAPPAPARP